MYDHELKYKNHWIQCERVTDPERHGRHYWVVIVTDDGQKLHGFASDDLKSSLKEGKTWINYYLDGSTDKRIVKAKRFLK